MKSRDTISALIIVALFGASIYAYTALPAQIPTHWNAQGVADGHSGVWSVFILPIVALLGYLLLAFLPHFDIQQSLSKNDDELYILTLTFLLFFSAIHIGSLVQAFGTVFNMNLLIIPSFGAMLIVLGWLLPKFKRNFFVGIRTPWTLSDDMVWVKTHRLGGKLFIACGILTFASLFLPKHGLWVMLGSLLAVTIYLVLFSYITYRRERMTKKRSASAKRQEGSSSVTKRTSLPHK